MRNIDKSDSKMFTFFGFFDIFCNFYGFSAEHMTFTTQQHSDIDVMLNARVTDCAVISIECQFAMHALW